MKTIEEKAKAYDEALKWMRELYPGLHGAIKEDAEHHFPELAESEDERIIEEIKFAVMQMPSEREDTKQRCLAYLDRQKEQKPSIFPPGFGEVKWNPISPSSVKQKPAEYGEDERIRKQLINICNEWLGGGHSAKPCLNDVRWLKNLLEKQEQKPTSFNEPYNSDEYEVVMEGNATSLKRKEQKQEFISISEMVSKYSNTDEYDDDGNYKGKPVNCMIRAYEQGIRDTLSKVKEQKPAEWSEEDEKIMQTMIKEGDLKPSEIAWLKSLRPQPKQEWSEEDETQRINTIIFLQTPVLRKVYQQSQVDKAVEWLRNLRPSWKPTAEQIGMVTRVCNGLHLQNSFDAEGMDVLLKQLEKIFWNTPDTEQEEHWKPTQEQMDVLRKYVMGEWKGLTFKEDEHLKSLLIDLENYSHDNR